VAASGRSRWRVTLVAPESVRRGFVLSVRDMEVGLVIAILLGGTKVDDVNVLADVGVFVGVRVVKAKSAKL
jgi:hypothetical protein